MYTTHRVNVMIKASPYIQLQCVLGMNTCTYEQNRGSMPPIKGLLKVVSEYDQEIPQSQTANNPMAPPGGYSNFFCIRRLGPSIYRSPPKNIRNFKHPKKNI